MFWKRKKKEAADPFDIEFELDRRLFYRVDPSPKRPVYFETEGRRHRVSDISAGGLSYVTHVHQPIGRLKGFIRLPDDPVPLPVIFHVVACSADGNCRGQLEKIRARDQERLHQYVLLRQKEVLAEQKELQAAARGTQQQKES